MSGYYWPGHPSDAAAAEQRARTEQDRIHRRHCEIERARSWAREVREALQDLSDELATVRSAEPLHCPDDDCGTLLVAGEIRVLAAIEHEEPVAPREWRRGDEDRPRYRHVLGLDLRCPRCEWRYWLTTDGDLWAHGQIARMGWEVEL